MPEQLSRNQSMPRFDVILRDDWPIEQCLLHMRVFFGGKTKSPCFDLFIHGLIKQITNTYRNHFQGHTEIALFSFICCFCFVRVFSFQGHTKIENAELVPKLNVFRGKTFRFLYLERRNFFVHAVEKSHSTSP